MPKMLTPEQVATMYEVDANTVRRWCARGLLPGAAKEGSKYRGYWLIPESALEGFKPPKPGPKTGR